MKNYNHSWSHPEWFNPVSASNARPRWFAFAATLAGLLLATPGQGADSNQATGRVWKPVPDDVYLQEVGQKIPTTQPATSVAVHNGKVFVVAGGIVKELRDGALLDFAGAPIDVKRLRSLGGALWAATSKDTHRFGTGGWQKVSDQPFKDFCLHLGQVYGATRNDVFRWESETFVNIRPKGGFLSNNTTLITEDGSQILPDPVEIGPIERIASYSGTLYLMQPRELGLLAGAVFIPGPMDWGALPGTVARDMVALGSRLYFATDRGLGVLRGMAMTTLNGSAGLPYEDATCLAKGFDGDLWIGTTQGAIRKTEDEYQFFGADHWLPGGHVRDIAVDDRVVYIATDAGLGVIQYEPYTLLKKSAWFEREADDWGFKRLGFVHRLYWAGDELGWVREISDNDGGHTAHYLAAMAFKYAATRDEKARQEAVEAFKAMIWLDDVTPKPGFIARAIWSVKADKGHRGDRGSGGLPAKWNPTDDRLWLWKGDTSSDEVDAHFYAVSLFHDLVADGAEKERAGKHLSNIASHIIDNGWVLRDMDGKPTRWGRWDPEYLLRPYGFEARGLNGMQAQTYMQTAHALTGDAKFQQGLEQLLKWQYHTYTVRQKIAFPPESVVPWDDLLAFRCYYPLLRYARDPELRSIYLRSIERSWETMRMQQLPFFNFIYGALTGNDCEAPHAVRHLREWSLDLITHSYRNSHRSDLVTQPGYVAYAGGTRAISPRESSSKWDIRTALAYDGGDGGKSVRPPSFWLEEYWMGRYYGLIEPPQTREAAATTLSPRNRKPIGAARYDGPARPPSK